MAVEIWAWKRCSLVASDRSEVWLCIGGGWCTSSVTGPYGVSMWKNISQGWSSLSHYILYEIGDGWSVKF